MTEATNSFKETEIGPIPVEWEVVPLRELAHAFFSGGTPSTKRPEFWDGDIPWTTSAYIDGLYLERGAKYITSQGLKRSASKVVPRGNLMIGTRVGVGKVAITAIDVAISQDLTGAIVDKTKAQPEFLAYVIQSDGVQELIRLSSRGTTIKGIPRKDLVQIPIPLPPLPEQRRIAHVLSTIQRAIAAQDDLIAAAREVKRSLMQRLFTYGPGPEPAPTKETEIGEIPENWEVVRLGDLAQTTSGGTPSRKNLDYFGGNIPWVKSGELNDSIIRGAEEYITDEGLKNSSAKIFPLGTLLIAMYGATVGKTGILGIQATTNQAICAIFPKDNAFLPEFLMHCLIFRRGDLLKERYGGAQPNISQTLIRSFPVCRPPLSEQHQIACMLSAADRKIAAEEQRKAALEALFKTMLYQLMTGQVRPRDAEFEG